MKSSYTLVLITLFGRVAASQAPPIGEHCAARVCEDATIYAVALDSALKRPHAEGVGAPRLLRTLYLAPFRAFGDHAPALGQLDTLGDLTILRRYWNAATIVDSAGIVQPDGHTLRVGGPLYILSPIDWAGEGVVRLQAAEYPRDLNGGAQLFIWLRRGSHGWHVTEITVGAIN